MKSLLQFDLFAGTLLKIRNKQRKVVPFLLNPSQAVVWAHIRKMIEQGLPPRVIILKGRQLGISSFAQALCLWRALTPNTHCLTVAHDLESTIKIFDMAKFFYENLPDHVRPEKKRSNRRELRLENPREEDRATNPGLRSHIEIRTAGNIGSGRGLTLHFLHASECSLYPQPELVFGSLFPAIPQETDTFVVLESTAHVTGQWFREFWFKSKKGLTGYTPIFLPWTLAPEYCLSGPLARALLDREPLTDEERDLMRRFRLTEGHIAFRRSKIDELGSVDAFHQDYPLTDTEAFVAAGAPLLPSATLQTLAEAATEGVRGDLVKGDFQPSPSGSLWVWEFPKPEVEYVLGVDTSQGTEESDPSCIQVLTSGATQRQVAMWWGKLDPIELAKVVEALGAWYNMALVAIEVNGVGITTQKALQERGYWNIYRWRVLNKVGSGLSLQYGWYSSVSSKPVLVSNLRHMIQTARLQIRDPATVEELRWFYLDARGGASAAPGKNDDRVMALGIASVCDTLAGGESGWAEKTQRPVEPPKVLDPIRHDLLPLEVVSWKTG